MSITVLNVAEKPSIAKELSNILSGGAQQRVSKRDMRLNLRAKLASAV